MSFRSKGVRLDSFIESKKSTHSEPFRCARSVCSEPWHVWHSSKEKKARPCSPTNMSLKSRRHYDVNDNVSVASRRSSDKSPRNALSLLPNGIGRDNFDDGSSLKENKSVGRNSAEGSLKCGHRDTDAALSVSEKSRGSLRKPPRPPAVLMMNGGFEVDDASSQKENKPRAPSPAEASLKCGPDGGANVAVSIASQLSRRSSSGRPRKPVDPTVNVGTRTPSPVEAPFEYCPDAEADDDVSVASSNPVGMSLRYCRDSEVDDGVSIISMMSRYSTTSRTSTMSRRSSICRPPCTPVDPTLDAVQSVDLENTSSQRENKASSVEVSLKCGVHDDVNDIVSASEMSQKLSSLKPPTIARPDVSDDFSQKENEARPPSFVKSSLKCVLHDKVDDALSTTETSQRSSQKPACNPTPGVNVDYASSRNGEQARPPSWADGVDDAVSLSMRSRHVNEDDTCSIISSHNAVEVVQEAFPYNTVEIIGEAVIS